MASTRQKDTLRMLRLRTKNSCAMVKDDPSSKGMITKIKDFVTWGELTPEMSKTLEEKGGSMGLHPPRGGFRRKGIKVPFKVGGALGYRGDKINELLERMMP